MAFQTKAEAEREGRAVQKLMRNPAGWEVCVSQNQGWHVSLRCGGMQLYWQGVFDSKFAFWTLMSWDGAGGGGPSFWTPKNETFADPNEAVDYQLALCHMFLKQCVKSIADVQISIVPVPIKKEKKTA